MKNKEKIKSDNVKYHAAYEPTRHEREIITKEKALTIYGNKCQHCGNTDILVLQWHHRIGRGGRYRSRVAAREVASVNKRLDHILLLCANCHIHQDLKDKTSLRATTTLEVYRRRQDEKIAA